MQGQPEDQGSLAGEALAEGSGLFAYALENQACPLGRVGSKWRGPGPDILFDQFDQ